MFTINRSIDSIFGSGILILMKIRSFIVSSAVLALAACGGSGSSSSGGGSNTRAFSGSYTGTANLRLAAQGVVVTDSVRLFVAIRSDGQMDVYFDGELAARIAIRSSGTFTLTDSADDAGLEDCSGTVTFTGRVSGNDLTGTISSNGVFCDGIAFTASGTMNATKVVNARGPAGSSSSGGVFGELYRQF